MQALASSSTAVSPSMLLTPLLEQESNELGEPLIAHINGTIACLKENFPQHDFSVQVWLGLSLHCFADPHQFLQKRFSNKHVQTALAIGKLLALLRQFETKKLDNDPIDSKQLELARRMLLGFNEDLSATLVVLCARLSSLRRATCSHNAVSIAWASTSLQIHAPVANRLGLWQLKWEIEDLSFRWVNSAQYKAIAAELEQKREARLADMVSIKKIIETLLQEHHIQAQVNARPKHIYSIWRKMQRKQLAFAQLMDLRAIRILVNSVESCYQTLALLQSITKGIEEEFDDYIARPKLNGYQSLHWVALWDGKPLEVQIRSHSMHETAERGIAAHWLYKDEGVNQEGKDKERIEIARQLIALTQDFTQTKHSHPSVVTDSGSSSPIHVLTPKGKIIELQAKATPIDYAYALHTDLGNRCRGAKVDGVLVALNTLLRSGQTVEILSAQNTSPSRDWLIAERGYVFSARAKSKIRAWFNRQAALEISQRGRELLNKHLQREGKTEVSHNSIAEKLAFPQVEALYAAIAREEISLPALRQAICGKVVPDEAKDEPFLDKPLPKQMTTASAIVVHGVEHLLTKRAKCCLPVWSEPIHGFITKGQGVSIHRSSCKNLVSMITRHPELSIAVVWASDKLGSQVRHETKLIIECENTSSWLKAATETLSKYDVLVCEVHKKSSRQPLYALTIAVHDIAQLHQAIKVLERLPGLRRVSRL